MKKILLSFVAIATVTICFIFTCGFTHTKAPAITLIQTRTGVTVAEGAVDKILLYGHYPNKGLFADGIFIEVRDIKTNALKATVKPSANAGYKPSILVEDFTGNGLSQIFLGMDSGGSGGYQYSYVFSVVGGNVRTLFDFQTRTAAYEARFLDNYLFAVKNLTDGVVWTEYIGNRNVEYLSLLYDGDGKLLKEQSGEVSAVNVVFPFYNPSAGRFALLISRRVTGLYQADGYGNMQELTEWKDAAFRSYYTTFNILGTLVS